MFAVALFSFDNAVQAAPSNAANDCRMKAVIDYAYNAIENSCQTFLTLKIQAELQLDLAGDIVQGIQARIVFGHARRKFTG